MGITPLLLGLLLFATEHHGQVMFGGVPVPGATVTAAQGDKRFVAITNDQGMYGFPELPDGMWTIQVEMLGFAPMKGDTATNMWELKMLPIEEIRGEVVHAVAPDPEPTPSAAPANAKATAPANSKQPAQPRQSGFQRTEVNASSNTNAASSNNETPPATSSAFANLSQQDLNQRAADGLLINGTVNNGAASPFAQLAQFGNNRRLGRPLYTGGAGIVINNSALNARSYSLTGQNTEEPAYNKFTGSFNVGGPVRAPFLSRNNAPQFFLGYQRVQNRNATTQTGRMPTAAERAGDFSQTLNPAGQPVQILDPATGQPFNGNLIPTERISNQARALMNLFPLPNFFDNARYNYQVPIVGNTHSDSVQGRLNKSINARNQIAGNFDIQSSRSDNANLFNFLDTTRTFGANLAAQWTTRPSQRFQMTFRYQANRQATRVAPYFANKLNVSAMAGITGNNQESVNWGSPTLVFAGGISSLSDAQSSYNRTENNTASYNGFWNRGRHNLSFGADLRRQRLNILSQQDARGTFTFTGAAAGSDFAGFLLGVPDTSSIAFGNADKYFRQNFWDAFVTDDWRMNGSLTINAGARWEYESPVSELQKRMVNLNITPDFSAVTPVVGNGLVRRDKFGIQPRISFAWRPVAASSLIVRGTYGVYRNTSVYQTIANQMAQQAPLSTSLSVQNTPANPLTLANGFVAAKGTNLNTFAIDPNFRVGYVQNWQLSVQRDLPAALQMTAIYLGTKGTHLPQQFIPNTFPSGAVNPSGYIYLFSGGNSIRNAGQIQLRRRLRNGFTASAQYTYAKSLDNAPLMSGQGVGTVGQGGTSVAQNWLDLGAERGRSNFDQRHQLIVQTQYTTGVGVRGGALLGGWRGMLFKEWTVQSNLTIGSGLPLTPVYFAATAGTGITGSRRPDATGASVYAAPAGFFLNPAAYRVPDPGSWGNAGRNSITGPSQFALNASFRRSIPWRDRYNIDLGVDATNVLNRVTIGSWNTTINNVQFGLPSRVDPMRTIQTTLRLRF
jgi:trimeric autotransporter adhesin